MFVHAEHLRRSDLDGGSPAELGRGPLLLRTYRADGSMDYEHNTLVGVEDVEPMLEDLLAKPEVATVHVRTVLPQCFLYAVTALRPSELAELGQQQRLGERRPARTPRGGGPRWRRGPGCRGPRRR